MSSSSSPSARALGILLLLLLLNPSAAHYNIKDPMPYNRIECNLPRCRGPCPPIWRGGNAAARNSPSNPSRTWHRGQTVTIEWNRNNHEGGYYRRSLVPVKYMNDASWHKRTAFEWGCFNQNKYHCGRHKSCGTDKHGDAYRNHMRVPNVFPDGDYVFSMAWFGGLHWRRDRAEFSDYHTCAFVRIRGGAFHASHTPTFTPGRILSRRPTINRPPPGKCAATSTFLGQCGGRPCHGRPVRFGVAGVFAHGRRPPRVLLRDLQGAMQHGPVRFASSRGENRAVQRHRQQRQRDSRQWQKKQQWRQTRRLTPRKGGSRGRSLCHQPVPRRVGSWGRRGSRHWWNARAQWWRRHNYCKQCRYRC